MRRVADLAAQLRLRNRERTLLDGVMSSIPDGWPTNISTTGVEREPMWGKWACVESWLPQCTEL